MNNMTDFILWRFFPALIGAAILNALYQAMVVDDRENVRKQGKF